MYFSVLIGTNVWWLMPDIEPAAYLMKRKLTILKRTKRKDIERRRCSLIVQPFPLLPYMEPKALIDGIVALLT
jgi:hypothetical protein